MGEVLPMGALCATAAFLKRIGVRRSASPLDWSRSTLPLWLHVLEDAAAALEDPVHVAVSSTGGPPSHTLYCEPAFAGARLWEHGLPDAWSRRCQRLRELLRPRASASGLAGRTLGLHLAFEADAASGGEELQQLVANAAAFGEAAAARGTDLVLAVVFFCSASGGAAHARRVCVAPPDASGCGGEYATLAPLEGGGVASCFACVSPQPNVHVLRYTVPHDLRNAEGNPLPEDQWGLLPRDEVAVAAVLRGMFPRHFCEPPR